MTAIQCQYTGDLHCTAQHGPSGTVLKTDAPTDHDGLGESFSPTDLLATALNMHLDDHGDCRTPPRLGPR